jgi:hypothetical protein
VTVASLVYGFAVGAPVGIWFVLRQWEQAKLKLITIACLYGYSLILFIPAAVSIRNCCETAGAIYVPTVHAPPPISHEIIPYK